MTDVEREHFPSSWIECPLGDVLLDIVGGGTPSKDVEAYFQGDIPLMTVKDMKQRRPTGTGFNITDEALANSSARMIPADTVIIATRMGLGKVVRASFDTAINQDLKALFAPPELDRSYLEFWLMSVASKIESMGTGTTVKGVRLNAVRSLEFPLAPLNEQQRIVEKIDTLFARLDKGEEAVREVQKLLTRYRQSVLKSAVTGQLTADWRAQREGELENGSDLLARVLDHRRENWSGRGRFKTPEPVDSDGLPSLPEGWVWTNGAHLFSWSSGKFLPAKKQTGGDFPVYGGNGVNGYHDEALVSDRTLVVGRVGAHCGNVHVTDGPAWVTDNAIYGLHAPLDCEIEFLATVFDLAKLGESSKGGAQPFVNQDALNKTPVPLPPSEEQQEIVKLIEAERANLANLEALCETELKRSASLRQSILKDAFAGRLVPQDPNDEPASVLLARITAEKPTAKKIRRKTTV